jgi:hypothetical protein
MSGAVLMPVLGRAKQQAGEHVGSRATKRAGLQNILCAYLSIAVLVGLAFNALIGWWWADPIRFRRRRRVSGRWDQHLAGRGLRRPCLRLTRHSQGDVARRAWTGGLEHPTTARHHGVALTAGDGQA